ncbi:MAG: DUF4142 domain-containing protein [Armatimonadota bacterium]
MATTGQSTHLRVVGLLIAASALLAQVSIAGPQPEPDRQPGQPDAAAGQPGNEGRVSMMDRRFVVASALGDMMEIDLSQMAQQRGSSDNVRSFAQRLVQDHQAHSTRVRALAESKGIELPDPMPARNGAGAAPQGAGGGAAPETIRVQEMRGNLSQLGLQFMPVQHREIRSVLGRLSGSQFDQAWVGEQLKHHAKTVADFEFHARHSTDPDVRAFASESLPPLREHLRTSRGLAGLNGQNGNGAQQ